MEIGQSPPSAHTVGKDLSSLMRSRPPRATLSLAKGMRETLALYVAGGPEPPANDREAEERIDLLWKLLRGFLDEESPEDFETEIATDPVFKKLEEGLGDSGYAKPQDWQTAARLAFRYEERGDTWYCENAKNLVELEKGADAKIRSGRGSREFFIEHLAQPICEALGRLLLKAEARYQEEHALAESDVGKKQKVVERIVAPRDGNQTKDSRVGDEKGASEATGNASGTKKRPAAKSVASKKTIQHTPSKVKKAARKSPGLIGAFVATALLALPLLAVGATLLASNPEDHNLEEARDLFKIDGNDAPKFAWQPLSPPHNPTDANPKNVSIFVCEQTVSTCRRSTTGAVQFRLTGIHHEDRRSGLDNWDFIFRPYRRDKQIRTPLHILYRINTDGAKVAALVWGDPGDDAIPGNVVGQLNSFSSTEFAEDFLRKLLNDNGLRWAKEAGLKTTARSTSLAERATGGGQPPSNVPVLPPSTKAWDSFPSKGHE